MSTLPLPALWGGGDGTGPKMGSSRWQLNKCQFHMNPPWEELPNSSEIRCSLQTLKWKTWALNASDEVTAGKSEAGGLKAGLPSVRHSSWHRRGLEECPLRRAHVGLACSLIQPPQGAT